MKTISLLLFLCLIVSGSITAQSVLYVSPSGSDNNAGTNPSSPTTFTNAVNSVSSGGTIYMAGGTYSYSSSIVITNSGNSGSRTKVFADGGTPIISFAAMSENSSNRGVVLDGDYWHFKGIIIEEAGDNGMLLSGNNHIIEECIFRRNHDSGLQLSRYNTNADQISEWPSNNLILNCEAYDNADSDSEDADGFAAKLTCGTGNVFRGCVSHHNIDDGWDLYTKSDTGPIGVVVFEDCIAHNNGILTDGSTSGGGDKNGFKLGSSAHEINHIVRRCIAFNNGKHGFTDNGNIGSIQFINNTSYNNADYNIHTRDNASHIFRNNVSFDGNHTDRIVGNVASCNALTDSDYSYGFTASGSDFQTMTPGPDHDPTSNGFLTLNSNSPLVDGGCSVSGISYNGSAPDLGAIEYGGVVQPINYTLTVNAGPGGTVSTSGGTYASATVVSVTATPNTGYIFNGWSGAVVSPSSATTDVVVDANKTVTANFSSIGGGGGSTTRIEDTDPGTISYDGSLKSYSNADNGTAINLSNDPGKQIVWSFSAPSSGTYEITLRYTRKASMSGEATIAVNGSSTSISLAETPSSAFDTYSFSATLNSGANTIILTTDEDAEFADIDWIEFTGGGVVTPNYTLTVNASNGSVSPSGGIYAAGTQVTLTATPNSGYTFSSWSGDANGTSTTTTITMDGNKTVTANFTEIGGQPTTVQIQEQALGFCSLDGTVDNNNSGFTGVGFANTENALGTAIEWKVNAGTSGIYTLQWRFANGGGADRPGNILINGNSATSVSLPTTGSWTTWQESSAASVNLNAGENTIRLEATTSSGLANIDWIEITGTNPSATSCTTTENYTLTTNASNGSINLSPQGGTYPAGTVVTLTAIPNNGYAFSSWSGDASGGATTSITMNSNKSVTANFAPDGGNGNVDFRILGYATVNGNTTGGQGGNSVTVSTGTALQDAISNKGSQPLTIYVSGTINLSNSSGLSKIDIKDVEDISILGLGSGAEFNGIGIKLTRTNNIIIRNLRIHHVKSGDKDCISLEGPVDHVWVDHCELYNEYDINGDKDEYDGLFDIKAEADYITFSWNYLHDSWKTSLSGSSESDDYDRKVTYHHNKYENVNSRLPLFRSGKGHIFNNYYTDVVSTTINSRIGACIRIENTYFENANFPWVSAYSDVLGGVDLEGNNIVVSGSNCENGDCFDYGSSSDLNEPLSCTLNVPYTYTDVLNSASETPSILNNHAGVGKINISASRIAASPNNSEKKRSVEFEVYPSPANKTVNVLIPEFTGTEIIRILNLTGSEIFKINAKVYQTEIDVSKLPKGTYIIQLQSKSGLLSKRFIKQ